MPQNVIFGPAMIPDKKFYRKANDVIKEPHYVIFSAETIAKIRTKFHKKKHDNRVNINHDGVLVQNVIMIESFLLDSGNRNALPNEFKDLPDGTWMISYEVENLEILKMINEKNINGFSVEGLFEYADKVK